MNIVCISDTHGEHALLSLPAGEVLVHAGDLTAHGSEAEMLDFLNWFAEQPFEHKLFIAGNHDSCMEQQPERVHELAHQRGLHYLNDSGVDINGMKFWGSPITPRFGDWSFMRDPGDDIDQHWQLIPVATDVLITHGPAYGILDLVQRDETLSEHTGCASLASRITELKPAVHVFGHIHECFGDETHEHTRHLNVASMDKSYRIANPPQLVIL